MSRSRKKHPGYYTTCLNHGVRKKEKKLYNKIFRRISKQLLKNFSDSIIFKNKMREIIDVWSMAQDGNYIRNKESWKYKIK